jgi:hypothetical protein
MFGMIVGDDFLAEEFAEIVAVLARSSKILSGADVPSRDDETSLRDRPDLIYDVDWNEEERLAEWQDVIASTRDLPVVLRAALLRQEGLAASHLAACISAPKTLRESNGARNHSDRLLAFLDAIHEAALTGLKEHDRLVQKTRWTGGQGIGASARNCPTSSNSCSRPIIFTGMILDRLKIQAGGAQPRQRAQPARDDRQGEASGLADCMTRSPWT